MNIQFLKNISNNFEYAKVSFTLKNEPHSDLFDDVYFSDCGGLAETEHVFINGNNIINKLKQTTKDEFIIGETGFGTGLNLLTLMHCYKKQYYDSTTDLPHISFLSVEKYPMQLKDIEKLQFINIITIDNMRLLYEYPIFKKHLK